MVIKREKFIVIAIDGGAASGKSSTSKVLAKKLHLLHIDTGSHYRAISFILLETGIFPSDYGGVLNKLKEFKIGSKIEDNDAFITINERFFTAENLRTESVNLHVSSFAAIPEIRHFLLEYQRAQVKFAMENNFNGLVMDGRDIGSVVLPNADFRFFLEADSQTRLRRRHLQGHEDSIMIRDELDSSRATAPLVCAPGAIRIDTSSFTLNEVSDHILNIIEDKIK